MNYGPDYDGGAVIGVILAVYGVIFGISLLIAAVVYVLTGIAYMKLFRKVGVEPWAAWVPFFNNWRLLEVGGQEGWLSILSIVPVGAYVSLVFLAIAGHKIGTAFRKDGSWTVLFIFLPFVWAWLLADDPAPYEPQNMTISGWKPPLAGYGSARGPYVPPQQTPPTAS
ncbi:MAG TPA: DUF5684 domain-containing protein [Galbitalea sp.]|jgi:hypothetical protein